MRFARSLCVSVDQRVGYRTHGVYVNNILYVPLARISGDVVAIATVIMFFATRAHPSLKFNHLSEGPSRSHASNSWLFNIYGQYKVHAQLS